MIPLWDDYYSLLHVQCALLFHTFADSWLQLQRSGIVLDWASVLHTLWAPKISLQDYSVVAAVSSKLSVVWRSIVIGVGFAVRFKRAVVTLATTAPIFW